MDRSSWKGKEDKQKSKGSPKRKKMNFRQQDSSRTLEECNLPPYSSNTQKMVVSVQRADKSRNMTTPEKYRNAFGRTEAKLRCVSPNKFSERGDTQKSSANSNSDCENSTKRDACKKRRNGKKLITPPPSGEMVTHRIKCEETDQLDVEDFILTTSNSVKLCHDGLEPSNVFYYDAWIDTRLTAVPMRSGDHEARRTAMVRLRELVKRRTLRVRECRDERRTERIRVYR